MEEQPPSRAHLEHSEGSANEPNSFARLTSETTEAQDVAFIKSNFCRVIHGDGAYGGPIAVGGVPQILMAIYSTHPAVPEVETFAVEKVDESTGRFTALPLQLKKIVHEIEAEVIISVPCARSLRDWLDTQIRTAEHLEDVQRPSDRSGTQPEVKS